MKEPEYKIEITVSGEETMHIDDAIEDIKNSRLGQICNNIVLYKKKE